MKSMLYVGHPYHLKTRSTRFLIDIFKEEYTITEVTYDMDKQEFGMDIDKTNKVFDVLVLFQLPMDPELLKSKFRYKRAAFFPMFDATGLLEDDFWFRYREFNIINFSSTLHKRLVKLGLSSFYIKYFPKPAENFEWGDEERAFLWQRVKPININSMAPMLVGNGIKKVHMHVATDPHNPEVEPTNYVRSCFEITKSKWFETKQEMHKIIQSAAVYVAPRLYEGIGMSFLEAMAMGRCVIAVNHPTMNEYIVHGETGLLYELGDSACISDTSIREMQKKTYEMMVEGYQEWEEKKHDILKWLEKNVDVLPERGELPEREEAPVPERTMVHVNSLLAYEQQDDDKYTVFLKVKLPKWMENAARKVYHLLKKK